MSRPFLFQLMECVGCSDSGLVGRYWIAETFLTSDGPRMRIIPLSRNMTKEEALNKVAYLEGVMRQSLKETTSDT